MIWLWLALYATLAGSIGWQLHGLYDMRREEQADEADR